MRNTDPHFLRHRDPYRSTPGRLFHTPGRLFHCYMGPGDKHLVIRSLKQIGTRGHTKVMGMVIKPLNMVTIIVVTKRLDMVTIVVTKRLNMVTMATKTLGLVVVIIPDNIKTIIQYIRPDPQNTVKLDQTTPDLLRLDTEKSRPIPEFDESFL